MAGASDMCLSGAFSTPREVGAVWPPSAIAGDWRSVSGESDAANCRVRLGYPNGSVENRRAAA